MNKKDYLLLIYLLLMSDDKNKSSLDKYLPCKEGQNIQFELYDFVNFLERQGLLFLVEDYKYIITNRFEMEVDFLLRECSVDYSIYLNNEDIFNLIKEYLSERDICVSELNYGYSVEIDVDISDVVHEIGCCGYEYIKISKNRTRLLVKEKESTQLSSYISSSKRASLKSSRFTGAGFLLY